MMWLAKMRRGVLLQRYLACSLLLPLIAGRFLRQRLKRGKEHPTRWIETQAKDLAPRPAGQVIWLNAVGLGEVLSLGGLIARLAMLLPDASFLVTSTTTTSAKVFAKQMPPRTMHQFLPIDALRYRQRFLDHFHPDLCLWVEQDLWPGFVVANAKRNIPQAVIAGRMDDVSFRSRAKAKSLFKNIYEVMTLVTAQDARSAQNLSKLGAAPTISGSLKPAAPVLTFDENDLIFLQELLQGRTVWAVAPSHTTDEQIALDAHKILRQTDPGALLIIVPRFPPRGEEIATMIGHPTPRRSAGQLPSAGDPVWLCDTFGELGLIYRLSKTVLIGGTFNAIEGHNPWEAAALNAAVIHGPHTGNFSSDYAQLDAANAAVKVKDAAELAAAFDQMDHGEITSNAHAVIGQASQSTDALAHEIAKLLGPV